MFRQVGKVLLPLCVLWLAATATAQNRAQPNTWSARTSSGHTLMGTWTAVPNQTTGTASGMWTLIDGRGRTLMGGGWSAAKSPTAWTGTWRATVTGRSGEYAGTWSAAVDLKKDATLQDLIEKAVESVVSGGWRAGGQSGSWSIRAFK